MVCKGGWKTKLVGPSNDMDMMKVGSLDDMDIKRVGGLVEGTIWNVEGMKVGSSGGALMLN